MTEHEKYLMDVSQQFLDGAITAYEFANKVMVYFVNNHDAIKTGSEIGEEI